MRTVDLVGILLCLAGLALFLIMLIRDRRSRT